MSADQQRIVAAALFFLLIFLSGFWLRRAGKPYNGVILTIHKLISLAAVVFLAITIYQINQADTLEAIELTVIIFTGLSFLATIITGGLLSTGNPMPAVILKLHQITPFLTVLSTAAALYLLLNR